VRKQVNEDDCFSTAREMYSTRFLPRFPNLLDRELLLLFSHDRFTGQRKNNGALLMRTNVTMKSEILGV